MSELQAPRAFTPLVQFEHRNAKGRVLAVYVPGLAYTARTPALQAALDGWLAEGKVRLGAPDAPGAGAVAGQG